MKRFNVFFIILFSIFVNTISVYSEDIFDTTAKNVEEIRKKFSSIYNSYKDVAIKDLNRKYIYYFIDIISDITNIPLHNIKVSSNPNEQYVTFTDIYKCMDMLPQNRLYYTVIFIYLYDNFSYVYDIYLKSYYRSSLINEHIMLDLLKYYKYINTDEYNTYVNMIYKLPKFVIDKNADLKYMFNNKTIKYTLDTVYFDNNIPVDVYSSTSTFLSENYKYIEHFYINNKDTNFDFKTMLSIDYNNKIINIYYK